MSNHKDTYGQALNAVREALNALSDAAYAEACANSMRARGRDNYDSYEDTLTTGVHTGVCRAHELVCNMINDHRKAGAA